MPRLKISPEGEVLKQYVDGAVTMLVEAMAMVAKLDNARVEALTNDLSDLRRVFDEEMFRQDFSEGMDLVIGIVATLSPSEA